jgi:TonB family protein
MWRRIFAAMLLICFSVLIFSVGTPTQAQENPGSRKVLVRVTPQYPSAARSLRLSGTVKLEATVATDGRVKAVAVRGGHPLLAQSAQNAVREWKWAPAAQETREMLEIRFVPPE